MCGHNRPSHHCGRRSGSHRAPTFDIAMQAWQPLQRCASETLKSRAGLERRPTWGDGVRLAKVGGGRSRGGARPSPDHKQLLCVLQPGSTPLRHAFPAPLLGQATLQPPPGRGCQTRTPLSALCLLHRFLSNLASERPRWPFGCRFRRNSAQQAHCVARSQALCPTCGPGRLGGLGGRKGLAEGGRFGLQRRIRLTGAWAIPLLQHAPSLSKSGR